ncbi:MAG TPA: hypothetical protein VNR67_04835 [Solirubrobacterales bacterium]|nr:hypothetical protein [Solirubrobacterales bacterium]
MKYLKMLGLAACAAMALLALGGVGSATATVLCSENIRPCPKGDDYGVGTEIQATLVAGTHTTISDTSENPITTCTASTLKAKMTSTGGTPAVPVQAAIESLAFTECTNPVAVPKLGSFDIEHIGGSNTLGTFTLKEAEIKVTLFGSVQCTYSAANVVDMGLVTGTTLMSNATFDFAGILPRIAGGFLCPATSRWRATYSITEPVPLYVKEEME